ncbi:MAG: hypothetical protein LBB58_06015 [Cellulomonadaceae bacterium]|nr:hypothetical protein [Cellulomonadaceae bacterium]
MTIAPTAGIGTDWFLIIAALSFIVAGAALAAQIFQHILCGSRAKVYLCSALWIPGTGMIRVENTAVLKFDRSSGFES